MREEQTPKEWPVRPANPKGCQKVVPPRRDRRGELGRRPPDPAPEPSRIPEGCQMPKDFLSGFCLGVRI